MKGEKLKESWKKIIANTYKREQLVMWNLSPMRADFSETIILLAAFHQD